MFIEKSTTLKECFEEIDEHLNAKHYTIDKILEQIDFVKLHYHNTDLINELQADLLELKEDKDFMDN